LFGFLSFEEFSELFFSLFSEFLISSFIEFSFLQFSKSSQFTRTLQSLFRVKLSIDGAHQPRLKVTFTSINEVSLFFSNREIVNSSESSAFDKFKFLENLLFSHFTSEYFSVSVGNIISLFEFFIAILKSASQVPSSVISLHCIVFPSKSSVNLKSA
jgi:hypothetical protein